MEEEHPATEIERTFRKVVGALREADVPFLVGGSVASWVRGGPQPHHDLDFMVRPDDAERALSALAESGMRAERPPEDWLLKAWDGDVLVDLIFRPLGVAIDDGAFERAETLNVLAFNVDVLSLEDVLVSKLLVLDEHSLDLEPVLQIARALREQVDWEQVRNRTRESPYAAAFFNLMENLRITEKNAPEAERHESRIRVVPDPHDSVRR